MLGWLHSRRKNSKSPRVETVKNPELPDAGKYSYLLKFLSECGPAQPGSNHATLSWQEIDAYAARTNLQLTGWEALMIRKLSRIYVNSFYRYNDTFDACPTATAGKPGKVVRLSEKMQRVLRAKHG